jgi:hypothetical protein
MSALVLSPKARTDKSALAVFDAFRSSKSKLGEAKRDLEALTPIVEGAHPVRLAIGVQLGAFLSGIARELLPESNVTTGAMLATAGTGTAIAAWQGRPDAVALFQGAAAPFSAELGANLVRAVKARMASVAAPSPVPAVEA